MPGATRLLLEVYPWLPLAFLLETLLAQTLMLWTGRRARSAPSQRPSSSGSQRVGQGGQGPSE